MEALKLWSYFKVPSHILFSPVTLELPASAQREVAEAAPEDEFGAQDYRKTLEMKGDHTSRPLWVVSAVSVYTCSCVFWDTKFVV